MATLKKYDLSGKEVGDFQVEDQWLDTKAHSQSVKDYLVAIRKNARQWSAHTKTRAEIQRTGRKPHPQKGGGRARQGDLAAPQYKGGGIVFGPRKKFDQHIKINQKERRAAIRSLIVEKVKGNSVHILTNADMKTPKTKKVADFLGKLGIEPARVLFLAETKQEMKNAHEHFIKSLRNIPKKEMAPINQVNGYALALSKHLVVLEPALDEFLAILGGS